MALSSLPSNGRARRDTVVVGASAGGVEALKALAAQLPADFGAAVCVVLHLHAEGPGMLPQILDRAGPLPAADAIEGEPLLPGRIYVAPRDRHLLVKGDRLRITAGPKENRARPAVDPLFRSAAASRGARVVGAILTGMLNDGASGLVAVKRCGGLTVVQDPADAAYPDMPESAQEAAGPDHVVPLSGLGAVLTAAVGQPVQQAVPIPRDIALEAEIAERAMSDIPKEERLGEMVPVSCPECSGPLWSIQADGVHRYRCHVGHGYTAKTLAADQADAVERALWAALRTLEERSRMLSRLAEDERGRGHAASAEAFEARAAEAHEHVARIRGLLLHEERGSRSRARPRYAGSIT